MRQKLVEFDFGSRYEFIGTFDGCITSSGKRGVAIRYVFVNVTDLDGFLVTPYTVFESASCLTDAHLLKGDIVRFRARVIEYEDRCPNYRYNTNNRKYYRLFYPTKVKKLYRPVSRLESEPIYTPCKIKIKAK